MSDREDPEPEPITIPIDGELDLHVFRPAEVAEVVVTAIDREEFLILPHPVVKDYAIRRASDTDRWIHGMTRMRNRIYSESD